MLAVIFGLITACAFAASSLVASRAVRLVGQASTVAWSLVLGLALAIPLCILTPQSEISLIESGQLLLAGVLTGAGMFLGWGAFRFGKVGVITPIIACEGAIAAVISTLSGEVLKPMAIGLLIVIAIGVVVSAIAPDPAPLEHEEPIRAVLMATGSAMCFGISLYLFGALSNDVSFGWILLAPRVAGLLLLFLPLLIVKKLRLTRKSLPYLISLGVTELIGFLSFVLGARTSVAVTAVVASQTALVAGIFAYILFRERLGRVQIVGAGVLVVSVAALTWVMGQ